MQMVFALGYSNYHFVNMSQYDFRVVKNLIETQSTLWKAQPKNTHQNYMYITYGPSVNLCTFFNPQQFLETISFTLWLEFKLKAVLLQFFFVNVGQLINENSWVLLRHLRVIYSCTCSLSMYIFISCLPFSKLLLWAASSGRDDCGWNSDK